MAGIFLCVHAAEFPAQALLRFRPELRIQPVAVMEGTPPQERVCSCNSRARKEGIRHNATRVEGETFSRVTLLRRSLAEEQVARLALLECAGRYSPLVEELSGDTEFCCVVDIAGTETLLGKPGKVASDVRNAMASLGIAVSVVVSHDFHTSVAISSCIEGVRIIEAGSEREALASLPLHALNPTPEQAETLMLWGIHTVGQFAALPEVELITRIGQDAQRLLQLSQGKHPHLFRPIEPVFELRESVEFEEPVELLESLLFVLSPMLAQLIARAASRSLAIASLDLELSLEKSTLHQRTVKPALASCDQKFLLKLLQLNLAAHPPQAAVLALTLRAEPDCSRKVQLGLFAPQLPESSRLDVTLMRLAALVGENRVGSPVLKDTHQPDTIHQTRLSLETTPDNGTHLQSRPALRRLRPATVVSVETQDRRPIAFVFESERYTVTAAYGPWRASGDWWAIDVWARDEWDVLAESANRQFLCCVIVQNNLLRRWSMEAIYD